MKRRIHLSEIAGDVRALRELAAGAVKRANDRAEKYGIDVLGREAFVVGWLTGELAEIENRAASLLRAIGAKS